MSTERVVDIIWDVGLAAFVLVALLFALVH